MLVAIAFRKVIIRRHTSDTTYLVRSLTVANDNPTTRRNVSSTDLVTSQRSSWTTPQNTTHFDRCMCISQPSLWLWNYFKLYKINVYFKYVARRFLHFQLVWYILYYKYELCVINIINISAFAIIDMSYSN